MDQDAKIATMTTLLKEYEEKNQILLQKKQEVELALAERSLIVAKLANCIAPKKQFSYKGSKVTIVIRGSKKDPTKPETYFFRGMADDDLITIE